MGETEISPASEQSRSPDTSPKKEFHLINPLVMAERQFELDKHRQGLTERAYGTPRSKVPVKQRVLKDTVKYLIHFLSEARRQIDSGKISMGELSREEKAYQETEYQRILEKARTYAQGAHYKDFEAKLERKIARQE